MTKILKPYTIIPTELYVQRDADRQVRNIISDMGRPGYVLVSRQMGKTNLLLHAKRSLESDSVFFVYIDLSSSFPSAKGCFEHIIDTALETYPEKFGEVSTIIKERRTELTDTPAHKQHTNELRLLLQALGGGKMIIILDEIDALTKTEYSLQIFTQIRSSYFASRINYKEFYNLTYLLSGVVEPNEILKDPKLSPFNIGQKIYLNDFSKNEFETFLMLSNLTLEREIIDRIFHWTNGNPRMTWDVCSEVENQRKHNSLTKEAIDKIVNDMYLTTFDNPPIDNIREIVKQDRELRDSIVEIEYKKGKLVSDRIKSRLYLAGIINYEENDVHIKNEIIRKSLNYEWIRELEEEDKGLIKIAIEEYQNSKFPEALSSFEKYLKDNEFKEGSDKNFYFFIMGLSAYRIQKYEKALEYFNITNFDIEEDSDLYFKTLNYKGLTYFYQNKIEECLESLKKVIANCKKDTVYAMALINYGGISHKSNVVHKDEAIKIFESIINGTAFKEGKAKKEIVNEVKSIAHFYLGQIDELNNEPSKAILNYKSSVLFGEEKAKPKIIFSLLKLTTDINEKNDLLNQIINLLDSGKIKPEEDDSEKQMDFDLNAMRSISIYAFSNFRETLFLKLIPHLDLLGKRTLANHLYNLALFALNTKSGLSTILELLDAAYQQLTIENDTNDQLTKYNVVKLIAYFSDIKLSISKHIEYLDLFEKERLEAIDDLDMEIFANVISVLIREKKYQQALHYVELINSVKESVTENVHFNYLIIYHFELHLYSYLDERSKAVKKAEEIIAFINDPEMNNRRSSLIDEEALRIIKQYAESVVHPIKIDKTPVRVEKGYGRNDQLTVRYKDGTILVTKFKKIENDLKTGACFIIK